MFRRSFGRHFRIRTTGAGWGVVGLLFLFLLMATMCGSCGGPVPLNQLSLQKAGVDTQQEELEKKIRAKVLKETKPPVDWKEKAFLIKRKAEEDKRIKDREVAKLKEATAQKATDLKEKIEAEKKKAKEDEALLLQAKAREAAGKLAEDEENLKFNKKLSEYENTRRLLRDQLKKSLEKEMKIVVIEDRKKLSPLTDEEKNHRIGTFDFDTAKKKAEIEVLREREVEWARARALSNFDIAVSRAKVSQFLKKLPK